MGAVEAGLRRARTAGLLAAQRTAVRGMALAGDPVARMATMPADGDVYGQYERIRERGPIARSRLGALALTSRDLCDEVLRNPAFGVRARAATSESEGTAELGLGPLEGSFLGLDPPDHTRLRRIASPAFRPRAVRGAAVRVEATLHRILDALEGRDRFDLVADLAQPFPVAVIADLMGVPLDDPARFAHLGQVVGQALDGVVSLRQAAELRRASAEMAALFGGLAEQRAREPSDDVVGVLAAAVADGRMTRAEYVASCSLLFLAGFETTVNLVGNAVAALQHDRELWERLVAEPALAPVVVEETLRHDPPVQMTSRIAMADSTIGGRPVPRGSYVLALLAAAGRDPQVYREPGRFSLDRAGEPEHLAFSGGVHYCLGAPLARLEGEVVLRVLAERLPGLHPAGRSTRRAGVTLRGDASYPVARGARRV